MEEKVAPSRSHRMKIIILIVFLILFSGDLTVYWGSSQIKAVELKEKRDLKADSESVAISILKVTGMTCPT